MNNNTHCIGVCNQLLRGERSAVETYDLFIEKYSDNTQLAELRRIRKDHATAITLLVENVRSMGGEPDGNAGVWGAFARAVQGTANLVGVDTAMEALFSGEQTGESGYEDALKDDNLMPQCKDLIRKRLLPLVVEHLVTLEHLQQPA